MKKGKNWLYIFVIVFCVSQMSYIVSQETFPWHSDPFFTTLFPVGIALFGLIISVLYTKFLFAKIKPAKYINTLIITILIASFIAFIFFTKYPDTGSAIAIGIQLSGFSASLFLLMIEEDISSDQI